MLSISAEALEIIRKKSGPIHLDMPPVVDGGCCSRIQECPTVRFGPPHDPGSYLQRTIQGITVYLPRRMPAEGEFTITVSSFLGWKWVVLEGWCPF
jgi:hypothetical protein